MTDYMREIEEGFERLKAEEEFRLPALRNIAIWLNDDEFKPYREQILDLVRRGEFELLLDSFYQVIPFGTGGRRGPVGIGPNRVNPWTVASSAQGHSQYLLQKYGDDARKRGVVLAYDVRRYPDTGIYSNELPNPVKGITSRDLAVEAGRVYAANGIKVYLFDGVRATPELSFAIRYLNAVSGDVFSASHNPATDNGKKVYDENGGQLIPPDDQELADIVDGVTGIKRMDFTSFLEKSLSKNFAQAFSKGLDKACEKGLVVFIGKEVDDAYLRETTSRALTSERDAIIVYSPLHGTGGTSVYQTLKMLNFGVVYDEKTKTPDGGFPNTAALNPEDERSFGTLIETGAAIGADILINSDPDADRLGICVRTTAGYEYLNGNQIAAVLTCFALSELSSQGRLPENSVVVKTLVTTELCRTIAENFGCDVIGDLLVGCKYIAEEIRKLEAKGEADRFVIGLEESHGYIVGTYARDKDAAPPAVLLSELAAKMKKRHRTIVDYLCSIYKEYGFHTNILYNMVLRGTAGKAKIDLIQKSLRENPPSEIAGYKVAQVIDRWKGAPHLSDTDTASRNVLVFELESDEKLMKVTVRPSGTEPKTKIYFEIAGNPLGLSATDEELEQEKKRVTTIAEGLKKELVSYCHSIAGAEIT